MNHASKFTLAILFVSSILAACATGDTKISDVTPDSVQQKLIKGKTSKADVIAAYGEPSGKGSSDGLEYWEYQTAKMGAAGFIPFASLVTGKAHIGGKSLHVYFSKKGVVEKYEMSDSNF